MMSDVSLPVITSGEANSPVTTQLPAGTGDVAQMGFTTVVAPTGACPVNTLPNVSNPQYPCSLFAFTSTVSLDIVYELM